MNRLWWGALAGAALCSAGAALAQDPTVQPTGCVTDTLAASFPRHWQGSTVGQITVRARGIDVPNAWLSAIANRVHVPTRLNVVLNELSFSSGAMVDSIEVLESVRRLRLTQLFSDVMLEGTRCDDGRTDLTLWTRDAFSIRANLRTGTSSTARASLSEANLFGTGRSLALLGESTDGRASLSLAFVDRAIFDSRLRGAVQLRGYGDGRAWQWSVRSRDFSPRDEWRGSLISSQLRRFGIDSVAGEFTNIDRRSNALTLARRIALTTNAVWALQAGVEQERVNVDVLRPGAMLGKKTVRREFTAPMLGIARRSRQFGAIDWLVPEQLATELALGVDVDMVGGIGRELNSGRRLGHADGWIGATAQPASGTVLTGDVWSSGYWLGDSIANGSVRFSGALYRKASGGMWIFRAASERLFNPDPDVFALVNADQTLRTLAPDARLAEQALSASIERSRHLYSVEGRWSLDAALFGTWSQRRRSVNGAPDPTNIEAVTVGVGLRRVRSQPTQAPLRFDIAHTVYRTPGLPNRWIVTLSSLPWINGGRLRDGQRDVGQR